MVPNKHKNDKNSATNVHRYNQFLAKLDQKRKPEPEMKDTMEDIIKSINLHFKENHYDSVLFHGIQNKEIDEYNDPNYNEETTKQKNGEKQNVIFEFKKKEKKEIIVDVEINTIGDLLKLIESHPLDDNIHYNIDMKALHNIQQPLIELDRMIGIKSLKINIVEQILYFIQGLHKSKNVNDGDFMHTVLYGPPGTGKTEIAKIMGKIYSKMGILKNGVFKKVTRSDLIAGYLGQTAIKTKDVIKECLGGVLFIDEAYALGNQEKRDSFSKECIDTLCEALSDHKHDLMVIIAGYEDELNECFFNYNQGLDSRFTWRFHIEKYQSKELCEIFLKKIKDCEWNIETEEESSYIPWFQKNMQSFPCYGRDVETLLSKIKISHSKRVFCKPETEKRKIILKDLEKGFELYLKNTNIKKKKEKEEFQRILTSMYV